MHKTTRGFTIVELLIVIVVIGILAAIVIVAFNGIQERAASTAVKSELSAFAKKIETLKVDSPTGQYTIDDGVNGLGSLGMKFNPSNYATGTAGTINLLYCTANSHTNYALLALTKNNKKFYVSSITSGPQEYTDTVNDWNTASYPARCQTVLPGSSNAARSGYSRTDTDPLSGPWRPWTGVKN